MSLRHNCPICSEKMLDFNQDAVINFKVVNGKLEIADINFLDNVWVECYSCSNTSENSDELKEILDYYTNLHFNQDKLITFLKKG